MRNKTRFNPYLDDDRGFEDDDVMFGEEEVEVEEEESSHFDSIKQYMVDCLTQMTKYKKCLTVAMTIMKKEGYVFEPFQLSVLYEHLFFYIEQNHPGILRLFLYAMKPYFAFDFIAVDHVIRMYTKKHYVSIIPRRHGKTLTIYAVIASFIVAFPSLKVLAVAQFKNIITVTKRQILAYVTYWTTQIDPGSIDMSFPNVDSVSFAYKEGGVSTLACISAYNDNAIRGHDPQVCLVDETLCIKPIRFNSILALGQKKKCKIGLLSSPTPSPESHDLLLQFMTRLSEKTSGINFYHIIYFCGSMAHSKYSARQDGCVNMMFYKPRHITFTHANKTLTEIMTCNTKCYDSELGVIREDEVAEALRKQTAADSESTKAFLTSTVNRPTCCVTTIPARTTSFTSIRPTVAVLNLGSEWRAQDCTEHLR